MMFWILMIEYLILENKNISYGFKNENTIAD